MGDWACNKDIMDQNFDAMLPLYFWSGRKCPNMVNGSTTKESCALKLQSALTENLFFSCTRSVLSILSTR
jgi:hypothetical protein